MTEERPEQRITKEEVDELDGLDLELLLFDGIVENALESRVCGSNQNASHSTTDIQYHAVVSSFVHIGGPVMNTAGDGSGNAAVNKVISVVINMMRNRLRHLFTTSPPSPGSQTPPPLPSRRGSSPTMPENRDRSRLRHELLTVVFDMRFGDQHTPGNSEALVDVLGNLVVEMSKKSPSRKYRHVKLKVFIENKAVSYLGELISDNDENIRVIFYATVLVMVYAIAVRVFGYTYTENMADDIDIMVEAALSSPKPVRSSNPNPSPRTRSSPTSNSPRPRSRPTRSRPRLRPTPPASPPPNTDAAKIFKRYICFIMCGMYYHADKKNKEMFVLAASWCLGGDLVWANGGGDQTFKEASAISDYLSKHPQKVTAYVEGVYNQSQQSVQAIQQLASPPSAPPRASAAAEWESGSGEPGRPTSLLRTHSEHSELQGIPYPAPLSTVTVGAEEHSRLSVYNMQLRDMQIDDGDYHQPTPIAPRSLPVGGLFSTVTGQPGSGVRDGFSGGQMDRFRSHSGDFSPPLYAHPSSSDSWQHPHRDQHDLTSRTPPPTNDVSVSSSLSPPLYRSRSHIAAPPTGNSSQKRPYHFPNFPSHQSSPSLGAGQYEQAPPSVPLDITVGRYEEQEHHQQHHFSVPLPASVPFPANNSVSSTPVHYVSSPRPQCDAAMISGGGVTARCKVFFPEAVGQIAQDDGGSSHGTSIDYSWRTHSQQSELQSPPYPSLHRAAVGAVAEEHTRLSSCNMQFSDLQIDDGDYHQHTPIAPRSLPAGGLFSTVTGQPGSGVLYGASLAGQMDSFSSLSADFSPPPSANPSSNDSWQCTPRQDQYMTSRTPSLTNDFSASSSFSPPQSRLRSHNAVRPTGHSSPNLPRPFPIISPSQQASPSLGGAGRHNFFTSSFVQPVDRTAGEPGHHPQYYPVVLPPPPPSTPSTPTFSSAQIHEAIAFAGDSLLGAPAPLPLLHHGNPLPEHSLQLQSSGFLPSSANISVSSTPVHYLSSRRPQSDAAMFNRGFGELERALTSFIPKTAGVAVTMSSAPVANTASISSHDTVSPANTHDSDGPHSSAQTQQRSTAAVSTTKRTMSLSSSSSRPHPLQPHLPAVSGMTQSLYNPQPSAPSTPSSRHPSTNDKSPRGGGYHHVNPNENELNK